MTAENQGKMRLTAPTVPIWAVSRAIQKMRDAGIPARQSTLVLFAIGKLIELPDDKLVEFAIPRHGVSASPVFNTPDDFLASLGIDKEGCASATQNP